MKGKEFNGNRIIIMTCSDCNTKCKHCYISYKGNFNANELYNICEHLTRKYWVQLNGTEILLHKDYFDSLQLVKQNFILTNGLEFQREPQIIKEIAKIGIKYVGISYHFGIHNDISSVDEKIIQNDFYRLKSEGIQPDMRVTITKNNLKLIPEMCSKAIELGVNRIKFTNYLRLGLAEDLSSQQILMKGDLEEFFSILNSMRKKYPEDILRIRRYGSFGNDDNPRRKSNFNCPACTDTVVMTPDYNIYPCIFLSKPGFEIGKMIDGKIIIYKDIQHTGKMCLAQQVSNYGKKIF